MKYPMNEDKSLYKLPKACGTSWKKCYECEYSTGEVRKWCPINGGDAQYEKIAKAHGAVRVFKPYMLQHGEMEWLEKTMYKDRVDVKNNEIWIENNAMKNDVQNIIGCRDAEKGEKVAGHAFGAGGDQPTRKIYSYAKKG